MIFADLQMFFMTKKHIRKSTFFDLGMSFALEKSISKQTFCICGWIAPIFIDKLERSRSEKTAFCRA